VLTTDYQLLKKRIIGKMAFIIWSDEYSVNINELDEQHKQLINIINRVYEASQSGAEKSVIRRIFVELAEYAAYHFKAEEKLLKSYGYPNFEQHRRQHQQLVVILLELQLRFRKGTMTLSEDMLNFLKNDWLLKHIVASDKEYSSFLNSKGVF
jgi:hemerythrin-like metal-binding protein